MVIPFERMSNEALRGVIEEFVTRDGTDNGFIEADLDQNIKMVLMQLKKGDAFIVYDEATMTTNILSKEDITKTECD